MIKLKNFDNIWLTSDTHFGYDNFYVYNEKHKNIFRPEFSSSEEADQQIIANINSKVSKSDVLIVLGDTAKKEEQVKLFDQINCTKLLVMGNHDAKFSSKFLLKHFDELYGAIVYKNYCFTHMPVHESELLDRVQINIHGHTHRNIIWGSSRHINACVEPNKYFPINLKDC